MKCRTSLPYIFNRMGRWVVFSRFVRSSWIGQVFKHRFFFTLFFWNCQRMINVHWNNQVNGSFYCVCLWRWSGGQGIDETFGQFATQIGSILVSQISRRSRARDQFFFYFQVYRIFLFRHVFLWGSHGGENEKKIIHLVNLFNMINVKR